jgi:predicted KAP-like P-loop ATPase
MLRNLFKRGRQPPSPGTESQRASASGFKTLPVPSNIYSSDDPADIATDLLGRSAFAERIAETLVNRTNPASLVAGLYGPWGDGKTSVLRMVEEHLSQYPQDEVAVVRFNAWFYNSEEQIIKEFFNTLAAGLDKSLAKYSEEIGQRLKTLGGVTGSLSATPHGSAVALGGGIVGAVGQWLDRASLRELRDRLRFLLDEQADKVQPVRIVCLIDDLDRLDKDEIVTVFRIVKLMADLPYTSYLIAFDEDMVAECLADRYPTQGRAAGISFLEKVIQVPLRLPRADPSITASLFTAEVFQLLENHQIQLPASQQVRLTAALENCVWPQAHTLREGKRFLNALEFAIPVMPAELNVADQVLVEALRLFYRAMYDLVRTHRNELMIRLESQAAKDRLKNDIDQACDVMGTSERQHCIELVCELFPHLQSLLLDIRGRYGSQEEAEWVSAKRVCSSGYFDRYFSYGLPVGDILDADVTEVIESLSAGGGVQLLQLMGRHGARLLLNKLSQRLSNLSEPHASDLALVLANIGGSLQGHDNPQRPDAPGNHAAAIVAQLLRRISADRYDIALQVVESSEIRFATLAYNWIRAMSIDVSHEPLFAENDIESLGISLAARIVEFESERPVLLDAPQMAPLSFAICNSHGQRDDLADKLLSLLEASPELTRSLLGSFIPVIPNVPIINQLSIQGYSRLRTIIPVGRLDRIVRSQFPSADNDAAGALAAEPGGSLLSSILASSDASIVIFLALNQRSAKEAPIAPSTIYEVGVGRMSPFRQGSPSSVVQGPEETRPDLVVRLLLQTPGMVVQFDLGPVPGIQEGARRDEVILRTLGTANLFGGRLVGELTPLGNMDHEWRVSGTNNAYVSSLIFAPPLERLVNLQIPQQPGLGAACSVMTGMCLLSDGAGTRDKQPGLMLQLDVAIRLKSQQEKISVSLATDMLSQLFHIVDAVPRIARGVLPVGDYNAGDMACWVTTGRNDLTKIIDLDVPGASPIEGSTARREADVNSTLPLRDIDADEYGIASDREAMYRQVAVQTIKKIFDYCGYRGYEACLHALQYRGGDES